MLAARVGRQTPRCQLMLPCSELTVPNKENMEAWFEEEEEEEAAADAEIMHKHMAVR